MKTSGNLAFVNQVLVGLLVTIGFGGSIGLGTVWMRHQISVVADTNAALDKEYQHVFRRLADATALVEAAMTNGELRRQNDTLRLGLIELSQAQIIHVGPDEPIRRLVARANVRASEREAATSGVRIQIPLETTPVLPASGAAALPAPASLAQPLQTAAAVNPPPPGRFQFALGR